MGDSMTMRGEELEKAKLVYEHVTEMVSGIQSEIEDLKEERDAIEGELEWNQERLRNLTEVQSRLVRSFPKLGPRLKSSKDQSQDLRGVPLGEAIEIILQSQDRPVTQEELIELLELSAYPLGEHPGRKIHAATLNKKSVRKVRPKTYEYYSANTEMKKHLERIREKTKPK